LTEVKTEKMARRPYLKYLAAVVAGAAVIGGGWAAWEATKPTPTTPTPTTPTPTTPTPTTPTPTPKKPYEGVVFSLATQTGPYIAGPVFDHRGEWKDLTGGWIEVVEIPWADLYAKVMADFVTGAGAYDLHIHTAMMVPDFSPYLVELTDRIKDPKTNPTWDDIVPTAREKLCGWGGKLYDLPLDGDCHNLFYAKPALENADHRAAFKKKYGYDIPAKDAVIDVITWEEYLDMAEFFNGWDWMGDGERHWGTLETCARGTQAPWWFWDHTCGFSVLPGGPDKYRGVIYFDPETMEPLVNQPGFVEGLTLAQKIPKVGPPGMLAYSVSEVRSGFRDGESALMIEWTDIGFADPKLSVMYGKVGCGVLPGATKVWDREKKAWATPTWSVYKDHTGAPINQIPMLNGGGWVGGVAKTCKNIDAGYDFIRFLNSPEVSIKDVTRGGSGFNPYRFSHFTNLKAWSDAGWSEMDAAAYLGAIKKNFENPDAQPDLKIPGAAKYVEELDIYYTKAMAGELSAKEACDTLYKMWEKITEEQDREKQKKAYHEMLGIP